MLQVKEISRAVDLPLFKHGSILVLRKGEGAMVQTDYILFVIKVILLAIVLKRLLFRRKK